MRTLASITAVLLGLSCLAAAEPSSTKQPEETKLLEDVRRFLGLKKQIQNRPELDRVIAMSFPVGESEFDVRRKIMNCVLSFDRQGRGTVAASVNGDGLTLAFRRVLRRGPDVNVWHLSVDFRFDQKRQLAGAIHTVSFGRWDGPEEEIENLN
jgi:hypothetical protein